MACESGGGTKHEGVSGRRFHNIVGGGLRVGGVCRDEGLLLLKLYRQPVWLIIGLVCVACEKMRVARVCAGIPRRARAEAVVLVTVVDRAFDTIRNVGQR